MTLPAKLTLTVARVSLGWLFFYAGYTKLINPAWTAAGYLKGAKAFVGFYAWLASPDMIGVTNALNAWGLALIGLALIFGISVRLAGILGALMMLLYYLPLGFPHPNAHSYIVDEHIVYAALLLFFAAVRAGRTWGFDEALRRRIERRSPRLAALIG
ncbi:MAG: DoxX family membrane protein [Patescibacteria group bacterium]